MLFNLVACWHVVMAAGWAQLCSATAKARCSAATTSPPSLKVPHGSREQPTSASQSASSSHSAITSWLVQALGPASGSVRPTAASDRSAAMISRATSCWVVGCEVLEPNQGVSGLSLTWRGGRGAGQVQRGRPQVCWLARAQRAAPAGSTPPTCVSMYAVRVWSVVPHTGFSSRMGTA